MNHTPNPYLRFFHSEELRVKTNEVLEALEQSENPIQYRDALGALVVELTSAGMDYFFIKPLELAKVGIITQKSADLGMAGIRRVMGPTIRKVIGGMDKSQLLIICGYIRHLMN